jgi:hypothetical protein
MRISLMAPRCRLRAGDFRQPQEYESGAVNVRHEWAHRRIRLNNGERDVGQKQARD